jgi:DNA topoisomerase IB
VPRLRRSSPSTDGILRRGRGRGFEYLDERSGRRITDGETIQRIKALVIPPAWSDVWICADPWGHLQAVGTDAAGRRQYRYHERWLERSAQRKFDRMLRFAEALPAIREEADRHLRRKGLKRERVLGGAVRLLDLGLFRVGGERYAEDNGTFGIATMLRRHVRLGPRDSVEFDYVAKGGQRRRQRIADRRVHRLVGELKERTGGGAELLAYENGAGWKDVRSNDINDYLKELGSDDDFTAKDFRTWTGTVLAAVALGRTKPPASERARKRAVSTMVAEVAEALGNTPAVARSSYIDPRVLDRYRAGVTIALPNGRPEEPLDDLDVRGPIEAAVLDLLG